MGDEKKVSPPGREATDESLRSERASADTAMTEQRQSLERSADDVVKRARTLADAVLSAARNRADGAAPERDGSPAHAALAADRILADQEVEGERASADQRLYRERRERARTLAALLPLEREKTDRDLLTERARSDDQVAHRDDFLGMVSHDVRNLLCAVLMEASDVSERASDSEEGRRVVVSMDRLLRYAARMNGLIGDLIDVVGIDAGKLPVQRERHDAAAVLGEVVDNFLLSAVQAGVTLGFEDGGKLLPADYDSDRILQVLANLVTNAIKFTPAGGRISLHAERMEGELRVCVRDTGVGISESQIGTIFERFWQVGKGDRRGLGLGLYISRCIVEAHGGKIWVESTPGEGSAFYFTILDQAASAASAAPG
jgi:signal transduction histidine kinase